MKVSKFSHLFLLLMASGGAAFALPGGYPNMDISSVSAQADKVTVQLPVRHLWKSLMWVIKHCLWR